MGLCTIAQVKTHLGISDADVSQDAVLTQIVGQVSARLAVEAGRVCNGTACLEKQTGLIQFFSPPDSRTQTLWLAAWPVIAVTEVKEAVFGGYDDVDALVENEEYQVRYDLGGLYRIGFWLKGVNAVRATFNGGYVAAGDTPGDGETALPADIVEAAVLQTAFWHGRRDKLGLAGAGVQGGSFTTYARDELLPEVRQVMRNYRRKT